MDEKQLEQMRDEWIKAIDDDVKAEKDIEELSGNLSGQLFLGRKCRGVVDGTEFEFIYRKFNGRRQVLDEKTKKQKTIVVPQMLLVVTNIARQMIAGKKYIPYQCVADVDKSYTETENLKAVVEAFIRHKTGRIKPEMQE